MLKTKRGRKGALGKWKSRWVKLERNKLFQYTGEGKPTASSSSYVFKMEKCTLELCSDHEFAFEITPEGGTALTLAAELVDDYDLWMEAFRRTRIKMNVYIANENENDAANNAVTRQAASSSDLDIYTHEVIVQDKVKAARREDRRRDSDRRASVAAVTDVVSPPKDTRPLAVRVDEAVEFFFAMNNSSGIKEWPIIVREDALVLLEMITEMEDNEPPFDMGMLLPYEEVYTRQSAISRADMRAWMRKCNRDPDSYLPPQDAGEQAMQLMGSAVGSTLMSWDSDEEDNPLVAPEPEVDDRVPLSLSDKALFAFTGTFGIPNQRRHDDSRVNVPNMRAVKVLAMDDVPHDWNGAYQELLEQAREESDVQASVEAGLRLAAIRGAFSQHAMEGARAVVEEYALPDSLKTVKRLSGSYLDEHADLKQYAHKPGETEVYTWDGLLFYTASGPAAKALEEDDRGMHFRALNCTDEVLHKIAGIEVRAIDLLSSTVNKILPSEDVPTTLLSTIVDYSGFRFTVVAPMDLEESNTLVFGVSEANDNLFVNARPDVAHALAVLAEERMNIGLTTVDTVCCDIELVDKKFANVYKGEVDVLSFDMQVHQCWDGRLYAINLQGLLAPDLARDQTPDSITHRLRPELYHAPGLKRPLAPSCMHTLSEASLVESKDTPSGYPRPMKNYFKVCDMVYMEIIPSIAERLDSYEIIHLDSLSLTTYLHGHGVPMRCMGLLFSISKSASVRQLLLTEMVARASKTLMRGVMKGIRRESWQVMHDAVMRGRSHDQDYLDYSQEVHQRSRVATVDLFNTFLGSELAEYRAKGRISQGKYQHRYQIWKSVLPDLLFEKFRIEMSDAAVSSTEIVPIQLFVAMQYHTGTVFKHEPTIVPDVAARPGDPYASSRPQTYEFALPDVRNPVTIDDLLEITPHSKVAPIFAGPMATVDAHAETFMQEGRLDRAVAALRARMACTVLTVASVTKAVPPLGWVVDEDGDGLVASVNCRHDDIVPEDMPTVHSPRVEAAFEHLSYHILLCRYLRKEYSGLVNQINKQLRALVADEGDVGMMDHVKDEDLLPHCKPTHFHSVYFGRLFALLMRSHFHLGNLTQAMLAFDLGFEVLTFFLGSGHPAVGLHFSGLADLYQGAGAPLQAHSMMTVAREHAIGTLGFSHHITQNCGTKMGILLLDAGKLVEAEELLESSYKVVRENVASLPPREVGSVPSRLEIDGALALYGMAVVRVRQERPRLALTFAKQALAMLTGHSPDAPGVDSGGRWDRPITALEKNLLYLIITIESHEPEKARALVRHVFGHMRSTVLKSELVNFLTRAPSDVDSKKYVFVTHHNTVDPVATLAEVLGMLIDIHLQLLPVKTHYFVATKTAAVRRGVASEKWDSSVETFVWQALSGDPTSMIDEAVMRADDYKSGVTDGAGDNKTTMKNKAFDDDDVTVAIAEVFGHLAAPCLDCFRQSGL